MAQSQEDDTASQVFRDIDEMLRVPGQIPGKLFPSEARWAERYEELKAMGYVLRRRYEPDWEPPWIGTKKNYSNFEDGEATFSRVCLDATRVSDGEHVMLKEVVREEGPYELDIAQFFSSESVRSDPRNRCVPLYEVLPPSGENGRRILVMPLLRPFNKPMFETHGETVAFMSQIFEGIQFMHEHHIAHRDCTKNNIMLDPSGMYPDGFHAVRRSRRRDFKGKARCYTRTHRPPKYYLIDFGLSRRYNPEDGPPLDDPLRGGDKSAPEHEPPKRRSDPFATDIYYLGNLIRETFIYKCYGFEFVQQLVADMVQDDPSKRPKIDEVVSRFKAIRDSLSTRKLRSRIRGRKEISIVRLWRACGYLRRTIGYILTRKAAIPDP